MSPRFERRPDKWAGAGGRRPTRPGAPTPRNRDRDRDAGRGDGGEYRRDASRSQGDRPAFSRSQADRPGFSRSKGERSGFSRSQADRPGASRGQGERPSLTRRPGMPDRRSSRYDPSRRDGARPRRLLPDRSGRPTTRLPGPVAVNAEPLQGLHSDDNQPADLIWGRHAALAALESGRPLHRIWCTPEMRFTASFLQHLREAKSAGVLVEEVTWARLGQLTGGAVHQGIVLQVAAADTLDLAGLIEGCRSIGEAPLLVALDGITDPQNLGAIARSAEALGSHGLVLPQRRSAGLTGSVAKAAAGALEHLPVARVVNLNRALDALKQEGYRVVGLAAEGSVSLEQVDLDGPLVIVTGSEGDGLSMLTRRHCDQLVSIPLRGATPSLNASVATALLLYEVARRGWMKGLRGGDPAPRIVRPQLAAAEVPSAVEAPADGSAPGTDPIDQPIATPKALEQPDHSTLLVATPPPVEACPPSDPPPQPMALQTDAVADGAAEVDGVAGAEADTDLEAAFDAELDDQLDDRLEAESDQGPDPDSARPPAVEPIFGFDQSVSVGFHTDVQL